MLKRWSMSNLSTQEIDYLATISLNLIKVQRAAIFNTMRILKRVNPGDMYLEAYLGHLQRSGDDFYDSYMLMWEVAVTLAPRRILEIGTRTGISLCQILSAYINSSVIEKIVCVDPFEDEFLSPKLVLSNLKSLNLPWEKVTFRIGKSEAAFPELIEGGWRFDYILVDGDHAKSVARQDLEWSAQLCDPGGIIVFDDISDAPGECALIDVWEDFKKAHETEFYFEQRMSGKGVAWAIKKGPQ